MYHHRLAMAGLAAALPVDLTGIRPPSRQPTERVCSGISLPRIARWQYAHPDRQRRVAKVTHRVRWVDSSTYMPHQGKRECARRVRQMLKADPEGLLGGFARG